MKRKSGSGAEKAKGQISTESRDRESAFRIWGLTGGIASGKSAAARLTSRS